MEMVPKHQLHPLIYIVQPNTAPPFLGFIHPLSHPDFQRFQLSRRHPGPIVRHLNHQAAPLPLEGLD